MLVAHNDLTSARLWEGFHEIGAENRLSRRAQESFSFSIHVGNGQGAVEGKECVRHRLNDIGPVLSGRGLNLVLGSPFQGEAHQLGQEVESPKLWCGEDLRFGPPDPHCAEGFARCGMQWKRSPRTQSGLLNLGKQLGIASSDFFRRTQQDWQTGPDGFTRRRIGAEVECPTLGDDLGVEDGAVDHLHHAGLRAQSRHIGERSASRQGSLLGECLRHFEWRHGTREGRHEAPKCLLAGDHFEVDHVVATHSACPLHGQAARFVRMTVSRTHLVLLIYDPTRRRTQAVRFMNIGSFPGNRTRHYFLVARPATPDVHGVGGKSPANSQVSEAGDLRPRCRRRSSARTS